MNFHLADFKSTASAKLGYTRKGILGFRLPILDCLKGNPKSKIQNPKSNLVDREGFKPSQKVCRTFMLSITSPTRKFGTDGEIRTHTNSFLRRVPLPFGYVGVLKNWSGRQDSNLRTHVSKTCPFCHLWNAQKIKLASGKGFEPLFLDSKSSVLPIGRPRKKLEIGGRDRIRTRGRFLAAVFKTAVQPFGHLFHLKF